MFKLPEGRNAYEYIESLYTWTVKHAEEGLEDSTFIPCMNVSGYTNNTLQAADLTTRTQGEYTFLSMCPDGGWLSY